MNLLQIFYKLGKVNVYFSVVFLFFFFSCRGKINVFYDFCILLYEYYFRKL